MGVIANNIGRRDASRLRLEIPARLDLIGGIRRCIVADLSVSGARMILDSPPRPGEFGVLMSDTLEAFGTVVWTSPACCGFRFDDPIGDAELIRLRQQSNRMPDKDMQDCVEFARKWVQGA